MIPEWRRRYDLRLGKFVFDLPNFHKYYWWAIVSWCPVAGFVLPSGRCLLRTLLFCFVFPNDRLSRKVLLSKLVLPNGRCVRDQKSPMSLRFEIPKSYYGLLFLLEPDCCILFVTPLWCSKTNLGCGGADVRLGNGCCSNWPGIVFCLYLCIVKIERYTAFRPEDEWVFYSLGSYRMFCIL